MFPVISVLLRFCSQNKINLYLQLVYLFCFSYLYGLDSPLCQCFAICCMLLSSLGGLVFTRLWFFSTSWISSHFFYQAVTIHAHLILLVFFFISCVSHCSCTLNISHPIDLAGFVSLQSSYTSICNTSYLMGPFIASRINSS